MSSDFTELIVVLASISLISWVVVAVTLVMRFMARARYYRQHPKAVPEPALDAPVAPSGLSSTGSSPEGSAS